MSVHSKRFPIKMEIPWMIFFLCFSFFLWGIEANAKKSLNQKKPLEKKSGFALRTINSRSFSFKNSLTGLQNQVSQNLASQQFRLLDGARFTPMVSVFLAPEAVAFGPNMMVAMKLDPEFSPTTFTIYRLPRFY